MRHKKMASKTDDSPHLAQKVTQSVRTLKRAYASAWRTTLKKAAAAQKEPTEDTVWRPRPYAASI